MFRSGRNASPARPRTGACEGGAIAVAERPSGRPTTGPWVSGTPEPFARADRKSVSRAPRRAHGNETLLVRAVRKPGSVPALPPVAIIPLGRPLLDGSCDLLGIESTRATPARLPSRSQTGLAPGGVYLAPLVTEGAVRSYRTVSPLPAPCGAGGLFSVALSFESPRLAVSQHPALRSPDFPRRDVLRCPPRSPVRLGREARRTISPLPTHPRLRDSQRSSSVSRISGMKCRRSSMSDGCRTRAGQPAGGGSPVPAASSLSFMISSQ